MFYILAIDGGGLRGAFPAKILECITKRLGIDPSSRFDLVSGTSTGSIIAAAVATHRDPTEIVELYRQHSRFIVSQPKRSFWPSRFKPAAHSKYHNNRLKEILYSEFRDTRLGEIDTPLMIFSTDLSYGGVHVFKSNYSSEFTRDPNVYVRDALLASCSAPTYFDPVRVDSYLLADGGIWANNPTLAAIIEAHRRFSIDLEDIRVLSLGTGHGRTVYGANPNKCWGLATGWRGSDFVSFLLSLQAQSVQHYAKLLLYEHQLLRIDFDTDRDLPLDDPDMIDDLIALADKTFTHESNEIRAFLI